MKNLREILEGQYDGETILPEWADFLRIGINDEIIQYFTFDDLDADVLGTPATSVEKLKVGESFFDEKDQAIWVMLTDFGAYRRP